MLERWEAFRLHVLDVISECLLHLVVEVCILLDEFWREAVKESQQVVCDQHLSVAVYTRADADTNGGEPAVGAPLVGALPSEEA